MKEKSEDSEQRLRGRVDPPEDGNRREYLKTAGALAAGLAVGAVAGWFGKPVEEIPEPVVRPFEGAGVTLATHASWLFPSVLQGDVKRPLLLEFEDETGINTNYVYGPEHMMRQKIMLDFTSGINEYELLGVDYIWFGAFASAKWIEPLEPYLEKTDPKYRWPLGLDDWYPSVLDWNRYRGKLYGLPVYTNASGLTYRADVLEKYGWDKPPKTFEELYLCCEDLADGFKRDGKEMWPMVMEMMTGEEPTRNLLGCAWAYGGTAFEGGAYEFDTIKEEKAKPTVNSPEFIKGYEAYKILGHDYGPPGAASYDWYKAYDDVVHDRAAMCLAATGSYWYILKWAKDDKVIDPNNVAFAIGPEGPVHRHEYCWSAGYAINSGARDKDAAWEMAQFLASPQVMRGLAETGLCTFANKSLNESTEIQETVRSACGGYRPTDEDFRLLIEALETSDSRQMPRIPEYPEFTAILGTAASEVVAGTKTPEKAANDANAALYEMMQKAGYYT